MLGVSLAPTSPQDRTARFPYGARLLQHQASTPVAPLTLIHQDQETLTSSSSLSLSLNQHQGVHIFSLRFAHCTTTPMIPYLYLLVRPTD